MTSADSITTVASLGGGTIGASWSALFLAQGLEVRLFDPAHDSESRVRAYIEKAWESLERIGLPEGADATRISFHSSAAEAVEGCGFVQESVPERLPVKHATFREIEPVLEPHCVVASSASGILVSEMQEGWADPSRFLLAHPFNPPHLIPLVELLGNEKTDPAALDLAEAFFTRCGKQTIRLKKEVPAHVANRLQAALWREAIHLAVEGVASVEDIDKAIVHGPGLRWSIMGPHMLFSLANLEGRMEGFCAHFAPSFHRWWDDLGRPELTPEVIKTLADGVREEEHGRSFGEITAERDEKLVALLSTFAGIDGRKG